MTLFINAHLIIWYVNYDSASVSYLMTLKFSKIWEIRECGDQYRGYHGSESCIRIDDGWMARLDTKMRDEDILNNIKVCQQIPNMSARYHSWPLMYYNPLSSGRAVYHPFLIIIIGRKWLTKKCYFWIVMSQKFLNFQFEPLQAFFNGQKWSIFQ